MFPYRTGAARPAVAHLVARLAFGLTGVLVAVLAAGWWMPAAVQAGTITIVDGPDTPPVNGVVTDGYIQAKLAAGNLTIDTSGGSGPDEIRVLSGAVINWTAGTSLTLDAGSNLVISGTIQHDGPANGSGGVRLVTHAASGIVRMGTESQTIGLAVGSRHGLTRVEAGNLVIQGGEMEGAYAQLGYHAVAKGAAYTVTGAISVLVNYELTVMGGSGDYAFVQIGHGGYGSAGNTTPSGSFSGGITVGAGGNVSFQGGSGESTYAQMGNGGGLATGNHGGSHTLVTLSSVTFAGGNGNRAFAQFGNGGLFASGSRTGDLNLTVTGNVTFEGGFGGTYAQMGNSSMGGGEISGDLTLEADGNVTFEGRGSFASAQFGNGRFLTEADISGELSLTCAGDLKLLSGGDEGYAMIGHGSDVRNFAGDQSLGKRSGNIEVRVGGSAIFGSSYVGHFTGSGSNAVTSGNTYIGVSQNDPTYATGTGEFEATSSGATIYFSSAPAANGGELRIYIPRETSQQIPTLAEFNGSSFATANVIPAPRIRGFYPFGAGPYSAPYSFYLGPKTGPDVRIAKAVAPAEPVRPGGTLTYTINFSNTGTVTATGVVISDSLASVLTGTVVTLSPDSGVMITQTGDAPILVWKVSDLAPSQGGGIELGVTVAVGAKAGRFSNTTTISATDELGTGNNRATVTSEIAPDADLFLPVLLRE